MEIGRSANPISFHPPDVLPVWLMARGSAITEADAAFMAGNALNYINNISQIEPDWYGAWRQRLALKCAVAGVRLLGRTEDELQLRDAVLLRGDDDSAGPAGNVYLAHKRLATVGGLLNTKTLKEVADLLCLKWDERLGTLPDLVEGLLKSARSIPFVVTELVSKVLSLRPDSEILAWWLADWVIARKLGWNHSVPLLISQRYGAAFQISGGRGRVRPDDEGFARAVCFAIVDASSDGLRLAGDMARRSSQLLLVAPRVRTKGADKVILQFLNDDALSASTKGLNLSRWASRRLFERLEQLGGIRELSGRSTFRIYGL